ncbi:ABC transporter ATP-binding protein [Phytoactinopolyspora endophytica]|uniref:ABC transporter ATP-binding protein n=1 Tax=Phytoactinopolyspora endophytica TaxID=1642495 RepID=UPI00101C3500|nr:ABC transporter ATP-binding protein [Phytoactinopolyspora endophytica]
MPNNALSIFARPSATPARPAIPGTPSAATGSLVATDLVKVYGDGPGAAHALAGVSFAVGAGESLAIMGPSGSGKTTLLHCLAGIITPTSGSVRWRDVDLAALSDRRRTALRRSDFGFVFQSGQLLPELPAVENAALPLMLAGMPRHTATAHAAQWLADLGLAGMEQRRPGELSGGQAQRVAIARALVGSPGVVFADEPTGALDQATGDDVIHTLVGTAQACQAALVVVTHDTNVARHCSRIITMHDGRVTGEQFASATSEGEPAR